MELEENIAYGFRPGIWNEKSKLCLSGFESSLNVSIESSTSDISTCKKVFDVQKVFHVQSSENIKEILET